MICLRLQHQFSHLITATGCVRSVRVYATRWSNSTCGIDDVAARRKTVCFTVVCKLYFCASPAPELDRTNIWDILTSPIWLPIHLTVVWAFSGIFFFIVSLFTLRNTDLRVNGLCISVKKKMHSIYDLQLTAKLCLPSTSTSEDVVNEHPCLYLIVCLCLTLHICLTQYISTFFDITLNAFTSFWSEQAMFECCPDVRA